MKKYFSKILISTAFVLIALGFGSCKDYLDKSPLSSISSTDAYKNFTNFQGFTEELYSALPIITASNSHNTWNWGEDEIWEIGETRLLAYHIDQGNYWGWNSVLYTWLSPGGVTYSTSNGDKGHLYGLCWQAIRKANLGLANLDKLTDATDEQKNLIAGQLYFFRGFYHFMLMQFWGGLPYVDYVLPSDQPFNLPRLKYQPTADKAAADFQKAADLLPADWDQTETGKSLGNNNIRINKILALSYLGKDLLWAGSPLMNYESTGNKTYNTDYCKKAADAFAQALQLCESTGRYELVPFSNYSDIFYKYNAGSTLPGFATVNNHKYREAMMMENLQNATSGRWRWNQVNDYRPPCLLNTGIKVYPTANYVDYYGMANGLPITDPTKKDAVSGYDPEYPWKNRDPRFYNDIIYDGVKCIKSAKSDNGHSIQYAMLDNSGWYRVTSNVNKAARTGYMENKFTSQYLNIWDGYQDNMAVVLSLMRLSDVYLMYAEATAVGYGTPNSKAADYSLSAVDAINKIRDRAGVGHVASKFIGATTDDNFLSELRRERAVELAFEGHRFTDLRRWLLLTEKPYTYKKAVKFDRANDVPISDLYANPQNGHVLNFTETVLLERNFGTPHYWLPFPISDVSMYSGFYQNPGW